MLGFFLSANSKMRRDAANWLEIAERVFHYRRDLISEIQLADLQSATDGVKRLVKDKAPAGELKPAIEKLEAVLSRVGGRIYPHSSMIENVEFFLSAFIVVLGLRAYFFQPFKIPTNSMWPTYHGMTHEIFPPANEPGAVARVIRLISSGATKHEIIAPADGEVYVAVNTNQTLARAAVPGKMLGLIPTTKEQYYLAVGQELIRVDVPVDFNFTKMIGEALAGSHERFSEFLLQHRRAGRGRMQENILWLPTGRTVVKGEAIATFHIHTGDMLFVDRISYNFIQPKIGDGFVFKTDNIKSPHMENPRGSGRQIKAYYIKRLVGIPGDRLEVRDPVLYRNGTPIEGADAFTANAHLEGKYRGYSNEEKLAPGHVIDVPNGTYFAMGDNSHESSDSRYWGFIPEKDVVGRPLVIYYPFSKRWGPAQ